MRTPALSTAPILLFLAFGGIASVTTGCTSSTASDRPAPATDSATTAPARTTETNGCDGCIQTPPPASGPTSAAPTKNPTGGGCVVGTECDSGVCTGNLCAAPSPNDGVKNGDETDIDCGGASAPACAADLACQQPSDCASNLCGANKRCLVAPSCTGGVGAGNQCNGESCCTSVRIPEEGDAVDYTLVSNAATTPWNLTAHVSAFRLDKYEVTVGRMRAFFNAMNGSPQANFEKVMGANAGANKHVPNSGWHSTWNKRLPASWTDIDSRYGDPALTPNGSQFCMRGADGDYGTSTWTPQSDGNPDPSASFDMKPMVCVDWYTMFAFCAWDGGRLPTSVEWGAAAGDDQGYTYPWGNDPMSMSNVVTALNGFAPWPDFTWGLTYRTAGDRGTHVAPVGKKSPTRYGIHDLAGNAAEWLLDSHVPQGVCNDCADISSWTDPTLAWPSPEKTLGAGDPTWKDGGYRVVRGGSWEGHDVSNVKGTWNGVEVGFTYHALGGRCARDL